MSTLDAALRYAELGYGVVRNEPGSNETYMKGWPAGLRDEASIRREWGRHPGCNVGIAVKREGDIVVLDIEGPKGEHKHVGTKAWEAISNGYDLSQFPRQRTPSGGYHIFGRRPDEIDRLGPKIRDGIEIFGGGAATHQVVVSPSTRSDKGYNGAAYEWEVTLCHADDLPEFPAGIFAGMEKPRPKPKQRQADGAYAKAAARYAADNPLELPPGSQRWECPVCHSTRSWGRLSDSETQWACWSPEHAAMGVGTEADGCWIGDALDLAAFETGHKPREILKASGYLKEIGVKPVPPKADDGEGDDEPHGETEVYVPGGHNGFEVSDHAFGSHVLDAVPSGRIFLYGEGLVAPMEGITRELSEARARNILSQHVLLRTDIYTKADGWETRRAKWTQDLAKLAKARAEFGHPNVLKVNAIVRMPMPIRTEGGLRFLKPGYNPGGYYMIEDPRLAGVEPMTDKRAIVDTLLSAISEFPYAAFPSEEESKGNTANASRANALAAMLSTFTLPLNDGPNPLIMIMAPEKSTGKTTLLHSIMLGSSGREPLFRVLPSDARQFEELVTSILVRPDARCVLFDNVRRDTPVESEMLEAIITSRTYSDRAKYGREAIVVPNNVIWGMTIQTGTRINADLASRAVGIYLDSEIERPEARKFDFDPIVRSSERHREIVEAMMGAVRLWADAKFPQPYKSVPLSRYDGWRRVMGGILRAVDADLGHAFLGNTDAFFGHAHKNEDPFTTLVKSWLKFNGGAQSTSQVLVTNVVRNFDLDIGPAGESAIALGRFLAKFEGARREGHRYVRTKADGRVRHELKK